VRGAGSDRELAVREAVPAPAIGRLEERAVTDVSEACLEAQRGGRSGGSKGSIPSISMLNF